MNYFVILTVVSEIMAQSAFKRALVVIHETIYKNKNRSCCYLKKKMPAANCIYLLWKHLNVNHIQ